MFVFAFAVDCEKMCAVRQAWLMSRLYLTAGLEALRRASLVIETVAQKKELVFLVHFFHGVSIFMRFSLRYALRYRLGEWMLDVMRRKPHPLAACFKEGSEISIL